MSENTNTENIKLIDIVQDNDTLYLFFNELNDSVIDKIKNEYEDSNMWGIRLGYEQPEISNYKFLGNDYHCINLWFDYESETAKETKDKLLDIMHKYNGYIFK